MTPLYLALCIHVLGEEWLKERVRRRVQEHVRRVIAEGLAAKEIADRAELDLAVFDDAGG